MNLTRLRIEAIGLAAALVVLLLSPLGGTPAHAGEGVDAVLVLDSSGSMQQTDPRRLRVPAAKMFVSLMGPNDRVGLISFSDAGYPVVHLTPVTSQANRQRLLAGAEKISSKGVYTNLHAALEKGREMLRTEGDPGKRRLILLMSDGKMDVGDAAREADLTETLKGGLVPQLSAAGIEVYTIAFTRSSDLALLESIAQETGGLAGIARRDRDLHEVFATLFESAKEPDMLPVEGGRFMVDDSVQEVTIVAPKTNAQVDISLERPDGGRVDAGVKDADINWFVSPRFDMITLDKPAAGEWRVLFSEGNNKAYVVTNVGLKTNLADATVPVDSEQRVEAWLHRDGELLDVEALLANTEFLVEVKQPDGQTARFSLFDNGDFGDRTPGDGVYSGMVSFYKPGAHQMRVIAKSDTFQREKSVFFTAKAGAEPVTTPAPTKAAPEPEAPEEAAEPDEPAEEAMAAEDEEMAGEEDKQEPATEQTDDGGIDILLLLSVFVLLNVVVAGLVALAWFIRRKLAARKAAQAAPEEGDDDVA